MNDVAAHERDTELLALGDLLLDQENPRFGFVKTQTVSQAEILDRIVERFGVDDVMSSLAVNGYFAAEPLVCKRKGADGSVVVAEGNRRLAACLILTGDPRASHQKARTEQYRPIWESHGRKGIDPVPAIIFDADAERAELLSYLGVRHISSAQPWDSYAKAAWVARVVEENALDVRDVALMIGDPHRTIVRMLEGFYFINQLISTGEFRPEDSQRRGRGSVTDYPFSWVYTLLGYTAAREYLELPAAEEPKPEPLPKDNLRKGALVARAMFGDRSKGQSAAIEDSRQLGELASALASPEKLTLLEQGRSISDIERITQPLDERLRLGLAEIREIQADIIQGLSEGEVESKIAAALVDLAAKNTRASADIERRLREASHGGATD